ncbi:hypothetical protein [Novosphingobium sp. ST904]|uniref:hypothetical protein n=1 Tax=Novosphingobium sp. ST904 TaxID=1684385 RepID=UPI0006C8C17B|nr:hypothetical protein [Novosphingobium sp. ST904]KPH63018.1 hypothetical protein ADT71_13930 [Novosphingobium sp. ST904]TCM32560.1 hypothetical protein EDF59_12260 [Novosphingobium sp. ST904]
MSNTPATLTVFIPLTVRKRNGRPKIMPPTEMMPANDGGVDPHVLIAIAKAWSWRRKLDSGEAATLADIAKAEDVTAAYAGRVMKLAYLAPVVLEKLLIVRVPPAVSVKDLAAVTVLPWTEQTSVVFERHC